MGVISDGSYGVPKGLVFSYPVTIENGKWKLVQGLKVSDEKRFNITKDELLGEQKEVADLLKWEMKRIEKLCWYLTNLLHSIKYSFLSKGIYC